MNNVSLNESCAGIPLRSQDVTLSASRILPLEIYACSRIMAIIKQLQFHMACSFQIEKKGGGGKSTVVKKELSVPILMFPFQKALLCNWA